MPKSHKAKLTSCFACKYLTRYKLTQFYPDARAHKKNLETTLTRILTVRDFRSLHPCSEQCTNQLRNIRTTWGKGKKALLRLAITKVHEVDKEIERLATNYALAMSSQLAPKNLARIRAQLKAARVTRGARQRRVNQLSESIANKQLKGTPRLPFQSDTEEAERDAIQSE